MTLNPWSKEAKLKRQIKEQHTLYNTISAKPISSAFPEIAKLESEKQNLELEKLRIINHGVRQALFTGKNISPGTEESSFKATKLPEAPGIVFYSNNVQAAVFPDRLHYQREVIAANTAFITPLRTMFYKAYEKQKARDLLIISGKLNYTITSTYIISLYDHIKLNCEDILYIYNISYIPENELQALAFATKVDIGIYHLNPRHTH